MSVSDREAYEGYLAYCRRIRQRPAAFEDWLKTNRTIHPFDMAKMMPTMRTRNRDKEEGHGDDRL